MVFYGILMFILLFVCQLKFSFCKTNTKLKICFFILYVLATFRSVTVGSDTDNYFRVFEAIAKNGNYTGYTERFEIGYLFINRIISVVFNNFIFFLMIVNFIIYYAYYLFVKKYSVNYGLSVMLFFTLGIWGKTINVIRLELAVAMFIYGYILYKDEKKIYAILISAFGVLFQRISIVFFAMYFIPKRLSKRFTRTTFVLSVIIYLTLDAIISFIVLKIPYFEHYISGSDYVYGEVKIAIVIQLCIHLFVYFMGSHIYKKNSICLDEEECKTIESQLNMVYVSVLVLFLSMRFNLLDRCETFFGIFILLLIPNSCRLVSKKENRIMMEMFICIFAIMYFVIINVYRPEWNNLIPYHTFLYDR